MRIDSMDGGGYLTIVDESNLSVYVRWTITNDVIRIDDEYQYYGYQSTFFNGQKVSNLVSVGTVGGGIDPGIESVGEGPITLNSAPSASPSDVTPATTYGFALDGRRISKAGAVSLKYLYDGENVVYELWDDMTVRFTHPVSPSGGCGSGCGAGNYAIFFTDHPISISIDGVKYYYLYDGLGSVTELIDASQNVVNYYRYTPFGDALIREETVYNPHQYTGRQYDAESGLYHYRARAYSPDIGRFLQQDPTGMVDGANMYAYVGNNPVNRVDPSGMSWCSWKCGIAASIAGTLMCAAFVATVCASAVSKSVCAFLASATCAFAVGATFGYACYQKCKGASDTSFCGFGCKNIFASIVIASAVYISGASLSPWISVIISLMAYGICYTLCKALL